MTGRFKYEHEIRLDEERIARYFESLPMFMDLPGEDEAILERITGMENEKLCHAGELTDLRRTLPAWEDDISEEEDNQSPGKDFENAIEYMEIIRAIEHISMHYSEFLALASNEKAAEAYLAIICQSGKTQSRLTDMSFTADSEPELKAAFARRVLHDINDLAAMLLRLNEVNHPEPVRPEIDMLQIIRKEILDIIFELNC